MFKLLAGVLRIGEKRCLYTPAGFNIGPHFTRNVAPGNPVASAKAPVLGIVGGSGAPYFRLHPPVRSMREAEIDGDYQYVLANSDLRIMSMLYNRPDKFCLKEDGAPASAKKPAHREPH